MCPEEISTIKDACSVILLRELSDKIEVFCVKRSQRSHFMANYVVFPGGKIDLIDLDPEWKNYIHNIHARTGEMTSTGADPVALIVAACRETFEEALILATNPLCDHEKLYYWREQLKEKSKSFIDLFRETSLQFNATKMVPWARWVTPLVEGRRFDARFFLLEAPVGQLGAHDSHETTQSFWDTPSCVLDRMQKGEISLAPPTIRNLELLASVHSVRAAIELAQEQSLKPICPQLVLGDPPMLVLPGDPLHEIAEPYVAGSTRFTLQDGLFR